MSHSPLAQRIVSSPVGSLRLVASDVALVELYLGSEPGAPEARDARPAPDGIGHPVLDRAERELAEYFRGERQTFSIPLAPEGTTFQQAVWSALRAIPFGARRSYTEVARAIGHPRAVRAVGSANAQNPISIVVPCHRVIRADGSLSGYGGGVPAKAWLLEHEQRIAAT